MAALSLRPREVRGDDEDLHPFVTPRAAVVHDLASPSLVRHVMTTKSANVMSAPATNMALTPNSPREVPIPRERRPSGRGHLCRTACSVERGHLRGELAATKCELRVRPPGSRRVGITAPATPMHVATTETSRQRQDVTAQRKSLRRRRSEGPRGPRCGLNRRPPEDGEYRRHGPDYETPAGVSTVKRRCRHHGDPGGHGNV